MPTSRAEAGPVEERISLNDAAAHLLDECRMVLPGIQALFGFQLVAVFNAGFAEKLTAGEQRLHLLALLLVVVAIALVMAPAAIHRQAEPRAVTERFLRVASLLLLWSMPLLAIGICLDVYLVGQVVLKSTVAAGGLVAGLLALFCVLWLVLPVRSRRGRGAGAERRSRAGGPLPARSAR